MSGCFVRTAFCGVFVVPYACISNKWVLFTHCFWRSVAYAMFLMFVFEMSGCFVRTAFCEVFLVPYACILNEWVFLMHCFWHSAPYAMFLVLVLQMSGCCLRTAFCAVIQAYFLHYWVLRTDCGVHATREMAVPWTLSGDGPL